jgi:ABC-type xylose transport system permease subunit
MILSNQRPYILIKIISILTKLLFYLPFSWIDEIWFILRQIMNLMIRCGVNTTKIIHLDFEHFISSVVVHLLLLFAGVPHTSCIFIILLLLRSKMPEHRDHFPARPSFQFFFWNILVYQLIVYIVFFKLSEICISTRDCFWILYCWIEVHSILSRSN